MSFLDNLENSLKSLENREDSAQSDKEDRTRREADLEKARAAAPFAERLRSGPFTEALLDHAARIGHSLRTKVHIAWMDTTLRLEARERKLELRPNADGVTAVFLENGIESRTQKVDLDGDPEPLIREWLARPAA